MVVNDETWRAACLYISQRSVVAAMTLMRAPRKRDGRGRLTILIPESVQPGTVTGRSPWKCSQKPPPKFTKDPMTNLQKLETRHLEIQKRNGELSGVETLTDEQRGELDTLRGEYTDVCAQLLAAKNAKPEPTIETRGEDSESVELRALLHDASAGRILAAVHGRKNTDGREGRVTGSLQGGR